MKILITGSSGFVGTHLTKLLSKKHKIIGFDLKKGQDILDTKLLSKKMKGADLVIHLAAFISAPESWDKPMKYMKNNSLGTLNVVKVAINAGVKKMIFFSSAAVKAKPLTPYAVSKISAEEILKLYLDKIDVVVVRPENIYGPGQKESYGYVIHNFIKAIKGGQVVKIFGNGKQTRDFIYLDDVVGSVEKITNMNLKSGTIISLGTGTGTKIIDLAKKIAKIMNVKIKVEYFDARLEPKASKANIVVAKSNGLNPKEFLNLEQGIRKLLSIQYLKK